MARATSEESDQPVHPSCLISLPCVRCPHEEALDACLSLECTARNEYTARFERVL